MKPKKDIIYSRGKSKFVSPSRQMIATSDNEQDPENVSSGATTPTLVA